MSGQSDVPPPPEDESKLLAWADTHGVRARLDDVLVGSSGPAGTVLPAHDGETLTYRQILFAPAGGAPRRRPHDNADTARGYLHRLAVLTTTHHRQRAWLEEHGQEPEDEVLAAF